MMRIVLLVALLAMSLGTTALAQDPAPIEIAPAAEAPAQPEPIATEPVAETPASLEAVPPTESSEPEVTPETSELLESPPAGRANSEESPSSSAPPTTALDERGLAAIDVAFGFDLVSRHLRYEDDYYGFLRPYDLPGGPAVTFDARLFPGSLSSGSHAIADAFGLEVRFDRSFAIESQRAGGLLTFPTTHRIVEVNALGRYALGRHELIGVFGYGNHAFVLHDANPTTPGLIAVPEVPDVVYSYLRIGVEARVFLHRWVSVAGGVSYLAILDAGGIQDAVWFPRSTAGGVSGFVRAIVPLAHGIELRAGIEYRRYFFAMNPQVGDPFIAGGALDQYAIFDLAAAYRY